MDLPAGIFSKSYSQDMAIIRTRTQWGLLVLLLVILAVLPLFSSGFMLMVISFIAITIIALHGLNLLTGYAGQVSLGHAAFMAVGGYSCTILASKFGLPFWITVPCGGLVAALVGMFFGAPSLRVRGIYLALATLGAHFIIVYSIEHLGITGGNLGLAVPPPKVWGSVLIESKIGFYFVVMGIAVLMTILAKNLVRSSVGRAFIAIRDSEIGAEAVGISPFRYKLLAFFISSFYAGIAGALYAHHIGYLSSETYPLTESIWFVGMLVVGGIGTTVGVIFGAVFIRLLDQTGTYIAPIIMAHSPQAGTQIGSSIGLLLFAVVVIVFLIFEPRGLAHRWEMVKNYYRLWPLSY